ncbi:MAG: type II CAAX prenyl endopeptidase Rce1 family protein, partial [Promethearchaeota archaeon]
GFLLPRTSRFGRNAAIMNVSLWSLYHIWAPWTIIGNIFVFTPIAYLVMKNQDLELSIFAHMFANFMFVLLIVPLLITI